jgi:hypothetical protein
MKPYFSIFFLAFFSLGFAQEKTDFSKNFNSFQLDYFYGNILEQSGAEHLITGHPEGFLATWNKRSFGKKLWEQHFNYPDIGFTFGYQDFKNESLGKLYAAYAHYNFYFFNRQSKNKLVLGFGFGLSYITNPYNRITNNKNIAIGSHLNSSTYLKLNYQRENIIKNIGLQAGFTFIHASNASLKAPNKGINTYGFNVGLNYNLNSEEPTLIDSIDKKSYREPIHFNANLYTGVNESDFINTGLHPFMVVSLFADKRLNRKTALQFGAELHLHNYLKEHIRFKYIFNGDVTRTNFPDWKRTSLFVGHELFINKISIVTQIGYYLYAPKILNETIYERVAMKTYFGKSFFASLGIKVHLVNAESLEFGIGYRF